MKSFNKLYGLSLLSLFMCFAACTSETVEPTPTPAPEPSGQAERRNVLLTLQNKLSVAKTNSDTKAETIATVDENKISSLDIYVFGSKTEDGTYTYQERFCYRENSSDLPPGSDVTAIDLNAIGDKGTETTALLSLKKGLFVKLYCIANQSKLIDPANGNEFNSFVPLIQSNPGQAGNTVTDGIPVEADFKLLQSIQLDPASATDLLLTPLPMTGAYTTPLDLTDFSVSARLQLGFRLTRSVARFDIINDAKTSKFTIQSVSMANGRKGVSFFPLTVTGTKPATAGDLITYPARKFAGEKANEGTCTGAFYSWPSPLEDAGYLILSGTYAANATENIPVTYKVPFKPAGEGNYIEVAHNHRYTVAITAADEYHLDFTITVADWTDEGSIDEYQPGGDADANGVAVNVDGADATYDPLTRTVTMPIVDDSQFTIEGNSTAGYNIRMYYENEETEHQWLTMDPPADNTKAAAQSTVYTIKKNNQYKGTKFPVAFIRFTDKVSAKETVVIVQPIANPVLKAVRQTTESSFKDNVITLYKTTTVSDPSVTVSVFASGGSQLNDVPAWLDVSPVDQETSNAQYTFTANYSHNSFPDPFPAEGVNIKVINKGDAQKEVTVTIKLKSAITVTAEKKGLADFNESKGGIYLYNDNTTYVKLNVNSIGGTDLINKPDWLTIVEDGNKNEGTYTFSVAQDAPTNVNQNLVLKSKVDNNISKEFTIYSNTKDIIFNDYSDNSDYSSTNSILETSPTVTYFPCTDSYFELTIISPKGVTVSQADWIKVSSTNESDLTTGQKQTKVRLTRADSYNDASFNTFRSNITITVTDKNNSENKKTFTVKQYPDGIVYPGSSTPATKVTGNGTFWVASTNGYGSNTGHILYNELKTLIDKGTACPSGWRVTSMDDFKNIVNITDFSNNINKKVNWPNTQLKTLLNGSYYWFSQNYSNRDGVLCDNQGIGIWNFGLENPGITYRCIKNF